MVYFPNGTAGIILDEQCSECPVGEDCCPIYVVQQIYNYTQVENENLRAAMNILIDGKGKCQMREALLRAEPDSTPIDSATLPGFLKFDGEKTT